mmetsp:Transcript_51148/g.84046  ORF Transcript_51148/g.84046 Transcript_51148/m.84046 type:complete len:202 (+) Transcript_51148:340-945(+)
MRMEIDCKIQPGGRTTGGARGLKLYFLVHSAPNVPARFAQWCVICRPVVHAHTATLASAFAFHVVSRGPNLVGHPIEYRSKVQLSLVRTRSKTKATSLTRLKTLSCEKVRHVTDCHSMHKATGVRQQMELVDTYLAIGKVTTTWGLNCKILNSSAPDVFPPITRLSPASGAHAPIVVSNEFTLTISDCGQYPWNLFEIPTG